MTGNHTVHGPEFYIHHIALSLRYRNDEQLSKYGITNRQARLLARIWRGQRDGAEVSRRYLEESMLLKGPSITSLLNGLERGGFISRSAHEADGRAMTIEMTEKGQGLVMALQPVFDGTERRLLAGFSGAERETFLALLEKALENVFPFREGGCDGD